MRRSTQSEMQKYYDAILSFAYEQNPVTVRGIYYHLTTLDLIPKTQNGYQRVARYCKSLRLSGEMPYEWISDSTRWQRKPMTYNSIHEALDHTAKYYRRDLLSWIGKNIEVWLEKDALAGVVYPVTAEYDIPLYVSRGFSSLSFLHSAAQSLCDSSIHIHGLRLCG